ncbi:hypothetical protein V2S85_26650, partial [Novosphingobium resinovorum]|nr:hypothetical protein [Novosphingobium resinovorum]
ARNDLHPILHLASFWSPERDSLPEVHQRRAKMPQHARGRTLTPNVSIASSERGWVMGADLSRIIIAPLYMFHFCSKIPFMRQMLARAFARRRPPRCQSGSKYTRGPVWLECSRRGRPEEISMPIVGMNARNHHPRSDQVTAQLPGIERVGSEA